MTIWRNRDFVWLFGGQTISQLGTAVSSFVVPLILLQMTGSALQMGIAFAVGIVPYLLLSLPAGVWADRFDRKKMMIIADVFRALLLAIIPISAAFDVLSIWELYLIEAGLSAFSAVFDSGYMACLPNVIDRDLLQPANSALQFGTSASQILGPTMAGALITLLGTTNTISLDVLSFLISIFSLLVIRRPFSSFTPKEEGDAPVKIGDQIREGLQYLWRHDLIRTISFITMFGNLSGTAIMAILLYHVKDELQVANGWTGVIMSGMGIGVMVGSVISGWISKRMSMGRIMCVSLAGMALTPFLIAYTHEPLAITLAQFLNGMFGTCWNIQSVTLRQTNIPDQMMGRVGSAIRTMVWIAIPLGSTLGGAFGEAFHTQVVFFGSGVIQILIFLWGFMTPLFRSTRQTQNEKAVGH